MKPNPDLAIVLRQRSPGNIFSFIGADLCGYGRRVRSRASFAGREFGSARFIRPLPKICSRSWCSSGFDMAYSQDAVLGSLLRRRI